MIEFGGICLPMRRLAKEAFCLNCDWQVMLDKNAQVLKDVSY
jgi:hypothetical protein